MMKNIASLKRFAVVTLNTDAATLTHTFKAGDQFKFLSPFNGFAVKLSRIGDCAKLIVEAARIGYTFEAWAAEPAAPSVPYVAPKYGDQYDAAHSDASGQSREIVIATVLAGPNSGTLTMHLTPGEEREYNRGMAEMAQWG
jgi:hypothetical protein